MLRSLRHRLIAGLSLLLLLTLGVVVLGIRSLGFVQREVEREFSHFSGINHLETALITSTGEQVRAAEAHLVAPSPALARAFVVMGDSSHALRRRFRQTTGLTSADQTVLNMMEDHQARLEVAYARAHALRDLGRSAEAREAAVLAGALADSLATDVRTLTRQQEDRVLVGLESLRASSRRRQTVVWLVFAAAIGFGIGTAFVTLRSIESPLDQLIDAARRFGEGDLRTPELGVMPDELATLARAMGQTSTRLRGMVDTVITESRTIAESAGDLSAMSEELASASHEISGAITGVATGGSRQVAEVRAADDVIARWREAAAGDVAVAGRVGASIEQIRALTDRQRADVQAAVAALHQSRERSRKAVAATRELAQRADSIGDLVDLGRQLAAQCEVLALNSAVEAARLGETAGGVGAIADQARRLADLSRATVNTVAEGTGSLRNLVGTIATALQGLSTGALTVESASERVALAAGEVEQATVVMRDSAELVLRAATENRETALQVSAMRGRVEGVARENLSATEAVSSAAAQQTAATGEIAQAAAGLLEASERLAGMVSGFRV